MHHERERERERERAMCTENVHVGARARVCVCEREREREREPVPQSNSDEGGPPGWARRYCSSCLLLVISSPVGEMKLISFRLGVPPFFGVNCQQHGRKKDNNKNAIEQENKI